jgi:hypothetical protein
MVMLIVIPSINTVLSYKINQPVMFSLFGYDILPIDMIYILVFAYGLYPIKYSSEKYFKKRGSEEALVEYHYIKKILYVIVPLLFITVLIDKVFYSVIIEILVRDFPDSNAWDYVYSLFYGDYYLIAFGSNLAYSIIAGIIRISIHIGRKDFRFYFAKACFGVVYKSIDNIKKAKYFIMGIRSYDKYLQKNVGVEIKDVDKIYSRVLTSNTAIDQNEVIQSITIAFDNNDKLRPANKLSKMLNTDEIEDFLIEKSLLTKIKDLSLFLATMIPVIIAIIQILLPQKQ